jgi:hypothetical protein
VDESIGYGNWKLENRNSKLENRNSIRGVIPIRQPTGISDCHEDARSALECGIRPPTDHAVHQPTDSYRLVFAE